MSVIVKAVVSSNIKTRWREPFASEAINKKGVGTIAPGVYRGLVLAETSPPVDLAVKVASDPTAGDHIGIAESSDGFSVNYVNTGGDFNIDLSSASLLNQTVVITLELSYSVGFETTGSYVAYTEAEYEALSTAVKNSMIVLGTTVVPGSGTIPEANISQNRRSYPSDRPIGQPFKRLTRNGGFEVAADGSSASLAFRHWRTSVTPGSGNADIASYVAEANSGTKSVEVDVTGVGSLSFTLTQDINVPVLAGQNVRVRMFKKALVAASSGVATVGVSYRDVDGNAIGAQTAAFDVDGVDALFVETGGTFVVPAGAYELAFIQVIGSALTYAGIGSSLLIDDVDLFVEETPENQNLANEIRGAGSVVGALTFEEEGESYASVGAELSFKNTDVNSGALELGRKDGSTDPLLPPDFVVKGSLDRLGEELIGSTVNADRARVVAPVSVFSGVKYTLMWESIPNSEKGYRKYVGIDGTLVETVNASWSNVGNIWTKDINGEESSRIDQPSTSGHVIARQVAGTNSWVDSAWVIGNYPSTTDRDGRIRSYWGPEGYRMGPTVREIFLPHTEETIGSNLSSQLMPSGLYSSGTANVELKVIGAQTGAGAAPLHRITIQTSAITGNNGRIFRDVNWRNHDDTAIVMELRLRIEIAGIATRVNHWFGIIQGTSSGIPSVGSGALVFIKRAAETNWHVLTNDGIAATSETDTTIPPVANVMQTFRIEYHGANTSVGVANGTMPVARYFIDGVLVNEESSISVPTQASSSYLSILFASNSAQSSPPADVYMDFSPPRLAYNEVLDPFVPTF